MKFIIEICEPLISRWMLLELEHASLIVGKSKLAFTNVKEEYAELLSKYGKVIKKSIIEIEDLHKELIILDPKAEHFLEPEEAKTSLLLIGGIMGDHPPKGRTYELLTSRLKNCKARNLGKYQLSIDGAVYVAFQISKGKRLDEIKLKRNMKIKIDSFHEIILPYAYPTVKGKPLFYEKLIEYLKYGIEEDEEELIKRNLGLQ